MKVYVVCPVPSKVHSLDGIPDNTEFRVKGIGRDAKRARVLTLDTVLDSAEVHGVLKMANGLKLLVRNSSTRYFGIPKF